MGETPKELEEGKVFLENWFQNLKVRTTRWRVPQNIQRCLHLSTHIQLELNQTTVWHSQGSTTNAKSLDYYPTTEEIFAELARHSKPKIPIPVGAKEINHSIIEPLTDQEKEEDYEVHFHISTFTSEDSLKEEKNPL